MFPHRIRTFKKDRDLYILASVNLKGHRVQLNNSSLYSLYEKLNCEKEFYVKIAEAENHALQYMDKCNLEHPKVQNKPCPLGHGNTQGLFDIIKGVEHTFRSEKHLGEVKDLFLKWIDKIGVQLKDLLF